MKFRVLGPLEVDDESGRRIELGTPKQRAVLALLLSEPNRVVSLDRIVSTLWGDDPPATSTGTLQSYISGLRRLLEPNRLPRTPATILVTAPPGYMVRVADDALDLLVFERLVETGSGLVESDPRSAVQCLEQAIALWRGTPFAELDEAGLQLTAIRLEERCRAAQEGLLAARLALGEHSAVIPNLERLVVEEPLRERGWELLILALHRSARQAEALRTLQRVRKVLAEEVGLDPGPRLIELERQIYAQDPALETPVPLEALSTDPPQSQPRRVGNGLGARAQVFDSHFVGREDQTARLTRLFSRARDGRGGLVLLSGEAGIGKTALVEVAVTSAVDEPGAADIDVVWARSPEAEGAPAYWPWAQAIGSLLDSESKSTGSSNAALLAHVVPDRIAVLGDPPPLPAEPAAARFAIYRAVVTFLRARAASRAIVIVLDDVHWADASSLRLLQSVASDLESMGVAIVATFRTEQVGTNPALDETLAIVSRERGVERIVLDRLAPEEVSTLLETIDDARDHAAVARRLHERTDGNPFFLVELVQLLASEGRLEQIASTPDELHSFGVPDAVHDVVHRRLARLPDRTRDLLTLAAVAGRDIGVETLEVAAGGDPTDVLDDLDPAVATRLLVEIPGRFGRYRFSHAIVRDALYQSIGPAKRVRLHKRVGDAIASVNAVDPSRHLGELAHHYSISMPLGTAVTALHWATRAAEQAAGQMADDQAAEFWDLAISAHERARTDDIDGLLDLWMALGRARRRNWDLAGATTAVGRAIDLAVELGDPARVAEAASMFGSLSLWNWRDYGDVDQHVVTILRKALEDLPTGDDPVRATALGSLAVELYYDVTDGAQQEGRLLGRDATDMARRLGETDLLARTLNNQFISMWRPDRCAELLEVTDQMLALTDSTPEVEATALLHRAHLLLRDWQFDTFEQESSRRRSAKQQVKSPELLDQFTVQEATLALIGGRLDDARRLSAHVWASHLRSSTTWGTSWVHLLQRFLIDREQHQSLPTVDATVALARQPKLDVARPLAILALLDSGRHDEARALLGELPIEIRRDWAFDIVAAQWSEVAVELNSPDRESLLAIVEPFSEIFVVAGTVVGVYGPMRLAVGRLNASLGDLAAGIEHLDEAYTQVRSIRAPVIEARVGFHLAELLQLAGTPTQLARASVVIAESLARCDEFGLPVMRERLSSLGT